MRVYDRGPDAMITAVQFVWLGETPRAFAIADLRAAHLSRRTVKGTWMPAAALAVLVLAPGYLLVDSWIARAALAGAAIGLVLFSVLWNRAGRRWELRAVAGGHAVTIYSTVDETTFNQVTRALLRVLEHYPEQHPPSRVVAAEDRRARPAGDKSRFLPKTRTPRHRLDATARWHVRFLDDEGSTEDCGRGRLADRRSQTSPSGVAGGTGGSRADSAGSG
jgi:hypothetical protein